MPEKDDIIDGILTDYNQTMRALRILYTKGLVAHWHYEHLKKKVEKQTKEQLRKQDYYQLLMFEKHFNK